MSSGVGDRAPDFELPTDGDGTPVHGGAPGTDGGALLLPERRHAGVHEGSVWLWAPGRDSAGRETPSGRTAQRSAIERSLMP